MAKAKSKIRFGKVELPDEAFDEKNVKVRISILVDMDVLKAFKMKAAREKDKYQRLMNRTLRDAIEGKHSKLPDLKEICDRLGHVEEELQFLKKHA